jgi:hypothetical protein
MTNTQKLMVTDAMVEIFCNAERREFNLPPIAYEQMARKTPKVVANITAKLNAVYPLIAAQVREEWKAREQILTAHIHSMSYAIEQFQAFTPFPPPGCVVLLLRTIAKAKEAKDAADEAVFRKGAP